MIEERKRPRSRNRETWGHPAIEAYTTGSAYAQYAEKDKGTLTLGMLADFVVLDRDLTKIPPAQILKTQVLRTVVGGRIVYETAPTGPGGK